MASRKLNDIAPECRPIFMELLARCSEAGIPVVIINTLRSLQEQRENLAKGVSWTMNSKHLPQPPSGLAHAIDICPYENYQVHGANKLDWNPEDAVWKLLGSTGQALGLRWGGTWQQKDLGHFEWHSLNVTSTGGAPV